MIVLNLVDCLVFILLVDKLIKKKTRKICFVILAKYRFDKRSFVKYTQYHTQIFFQQLAVDTQ